MRLHVREGEIHRGLRLPRTNSYGRHRAQRVVFDSNVEVAPEIVTPPPEEVINFSTWTVAHLKDYLDLLNVSYPAGALKADLIVLAEATL